jgi:hypothetical protein
LQEVPVPCIDLEFCDGAAGAGLPEKTIAKNFVPVITYPHSDSKHLEKPPFTKAA